MTGCKMAPFRRTLGISRANPKPMTTPAWSLESNGIAEAFVHPMRRGNLARADLSTAAVVLDQVRA